MVYEGSNEDLERDLRHAQQSGLVYRSGDTYRFLHDRVQEAAYSLLPETQRAAAHLRIGRLLAAHTPLENREAAIFEIVNQLNRAAALISSRAEKEQLAEFNLMAGKRAKASTAYESALKYFVAGTDLLSDDGWEQRPDLMFPLELYGRSASFDNRTQVADCVLPDLAPNEFSDPYATKANETTLLKVNSASGVLVRLG
jgi:predicted ATPase